MYVKSELFKEDCRSSVYKCVKDVVCGHGTFVRDSIVMLYKTDGGYLVFDFNSVIETADSSCINLYCPGMKDRAVWDKVSMRDEDINKYFEKEIYLTDRVQNVCKLISTRESQVSVAVIILCIIVIALFVVFIDSDIFVQMRSSLFVISFASVFVSLVECIAFVIYLKSYAQKMFRLHLSECFSFERENMSWSADV